MARTINRVELLGRVGNDPELRSTKNGVAVVQLRLATDRRSQNNESQTDWHTVVVWAKTAEAVANYVRRGDRVHVTGNLRQRTWQTDSGEPRSRVEVHAGEVIFLDSRSDRRDTHEEDGDAPF